VKLQRKKFFLPGWHSGNGDSEEESKVEFEFLIDNTLHKISLEKKENTFVVSDGEKTYDADIRYISPNIISILIEGRSYRVYFARDKEKWFLSLEGQQFTVQEPLESGEDLQKDEVRSREDELMVKAPMPGKVIKIDVSEKEKVRKNQTLAVVEAMKMENEIKSTIDGYVKKIFVSAGDLVDSEKPLIELEIKE
jgi:biotin carboxyl carrier protein